MKSERVANFAGLTATVSGRNNETFAYANMVDTPIKGTSEWTNYELVLDVHPRAYVNSIGVQLRGRGKIWVAHFGFEEVGLDVPTTDTGTEALNLDFSEVETGDPACHHFRCLRRICRFNSTAIYWLDSKA